MFELRVSLKAVLLKFTPMFLGAVWGNPRASWVHRQLCLAFDVTLQEKPLLLTDARSGNIGTMLIPESSVKPLIV